MSVENVQCPLCSSLEKKLEALARDYEYFTSEELFSYYECLKCKAVYLKNPPLHRLKEIYPKNYYSNQSDENESILLKLKSLVETFFFRRILKAIPGTMLSALDIGGGSGWILNTLRKADPRILKTMVVDLDESAKVLAEKNGHDFFLGRIEDFRVPLNESEKFDFINMLNLVEHVADPITLLTKVNEFLKPGGVLLVKTPNTDTIDRYIFKSLYWGGLHCPRHWVLFNKQNLLEAARKAGFKTRYFKYTQGAPQWVVSVFGSLILKNLISVPKPNTISSHPLFLPVFLLFILIDIPRSWFMKTGQMFVVFEKNQLG